MPPPDPVDEQRTSAVFLPYPPDLVKRLSPREETPPPLSPIPSESDLSERRYSDVSVPSIVDQEQSETERLRLWDMTHRDNLPQPPPPLFCRDRSAPVVPTALHNRAPPGLSVRVPSPRLGPQRRAADVLADLPLPARHTDVLAEVPMPLHSPSMTIRKKKDQVQHDAPVKEKRSPWWRWWKGKNKKEREGKKEPEPISKETKEWWGESFRALRLRAERNQSNSGMFASSAVREATPRGMGRKRSAMCSFGSLEKGDSLGSLPQLQRERLAHVDAQREAYSFAGVKGKWGVEGSSVSSSEDREDAESHLYLSRRHLRSMQYR